MGFCFSCCRRQKKPEDSEREPLLKRNLTAHTDGPPQTNLDRLSDVLAALKVGKLPNQEQTNAVIRRVISSNILNAGLGRETLDADMDAEARKLVACVKEVLEAALQLGMEKNDDDKAQELLYHLRQMSSTPVDITVPPVTLEANEETSRQIQKAALAIPSQQEIATDTEALLRAMRSLSSLLLTSSAFRLILSDLLLSARGFISNVALSVKSVAQQVESAAEVVDAHVRPSEPSSALSRNEGGAENTDAALPSKSHGNNQEYKSPKEVVLDRLEQVIIQAQSSPQYNSALRTMLFLLRKYASRVQVAAMAASQVASSQSGSSDPAAKLANLAPIISPDPAAIKVMDGCRILLERFASGMSLDPLLGSLFDTVNDIAVSPDRNAEEAQRLFSRIGAWLDRALTSPGWANSREGRKDVENLYDMGTNILQKDGAVSKDLEQVLDRTENFADSLKNDRSTRRFITALSNLTAESAGFTQQSLLSAGRAAAHWRMRLMKMALGWLIPRLLRAVRTVPMPRVEFVSRKPGGEQLAVAIDALMLKAQEELVPDEMKIVEWGELKIEMGDRDGYEFAAPSATGDSSALAPGSMANLLSGNSVTTEEAVVREDHRQARVSSVSRIRVHIAGLRVAAYDVGYFARYNYLSWLGYEDEGLLSAIIGEPGKKGDGLNFDVELEMDATTDHREASTGDEEEKRLFRVIDVAVDLPGLSLDIRKSHHWILNSLFFAPFAGPIGRTVGSRILSSQVRSLLESLEVKLRHAKKHADETAAARHDREGDQESDTSQSTLGDWWEGFVVTFGGDPPNEDEEDTYEETTTSATLKGVVSTTYTQPEPPAASEEAPASIPSPSETVLAVGLGAQILPGKGEPFARESLGEVSNDIGGEIRREIGEVEEQVEHLDETVDSGVKAAADTRREFDKAGERMARKTNEEGRRVGWRSHAFDAFIL